jgi:hypothetical protein
MPFLNPALLLCSQLAKHLPQVPAQLPVQRLAPVAHDDCDSAEVRGVAGGGVYQGQERDSFGAKLRERCRNFVGRRFWARGYFVSTFGRDEQVIREYIRHQEEEDKRLDQLQLGVGGHL